MEWFQKDALCLAIDIFPDEVVKRFFFPTSGRFLFDVVHGNRFLPKDIKENVLFITIALNIFVISVVSKSLGNLKILVRAVLKQLCLCHRNGPK